MNRIRLIADYLSAAWAGETTDAALIASVLLATMVLAAYEYVVYRLVSHRSFYNRAFHISVAVLPFFISTIILCLQSNLVITLGTIGALAILRFRTAVKDPVDMLYLLWSVHIGITCGCQMYRVAALTSLTVTVVMLALNRIRLGSAPYTLVLRCPAEAEAGLLALVREYSRRCRVKSRGFSAGGLDLTAELFVKDPAALSEALSKADGLERFSLLEYDYEDLV